GEIDFEKVDVKALPKPKLIPIEEKAIMAQVNKEMPGHGLKYNGEWETMPGKPLVYQFTPQEGPIEGATFSTTSFKPEAIKAGLKKMITIRAKPKIVPKVEPKVAPKVEPKAPPKGKLVILKDKKKLLADIDKAIKEAPAKPETKTVYEATISDKWYKERVKIIRPTEAEAKKVAEEQLKKDEYINVMAREQPIETITFEIDGGAHVFDSKDALTAFREKVQKTKEGAKIGIPNCGIGVFETPVPTSGSCM
ncbi:unnamed protein product, partial [marine sediment metagenome]